MIRPARLMLLPEDVTEADGVGLWRHNRAMREDRLPKNGVSNDPTHSLAIHIHGARCECAGCLYLGPHCSWNKYDIRRADYEDWIDAKGISQRHHNLIVQCDDQDHWAYLLVYSGDHPYYEMIGWCWGYEAKTVPVSDPVGGRPLISCPRTPHSSNHPSRSTTRCAPDRQRRQTGYCPS